MVLRVVSSFSEDFTKL